MLHIIGMILKIIGIILAVILGILVLLICIVLFVPLKYEIHGKFEGNLDSAKVTVRCSWLLHLIAASLSFENRELTWRARIVHKTFSSEETETEAEETAESVIEDLATDTERTLKAEALKHPEGEQEAERAITVQECGPEEEEPVMKPPETSGVLEEETKQPEKESIWVRVKTKLKEFRNKIKAFFRNIKYTFGKICDKIKVLLEQKEMIVEFIEDEGHRQACVRLKKEAVRLLKFLRPKKFVLKTKFGFEDPCHTGQALAALSVIYPFLGGEVSVEPDFEKRILQGELLIKGKIRGVFGLIAVWNLFWDKNVRRLYADVKQMGSKA